MLLHPQIVPARNESGKFRYFHPRLPLEAAVQFEFSPVSLNTHTLLGCELGPVHIISTNHG